MVLNLEHHQYQDQDSLTAQAACSAIPMGSGSGHPIGSSSSNAAHDLLPLRCSSCDFLWIPTRMVNRRFHPSHSQSQAKGLLPIAPPTQASPWGVTTGSRMADVPPGSWTAILQSASAVCRISYFHQWFMRETSQLLLSIFLRAVPRISFTCPFHFLKNDFSLLVIGFNKVILSINVKGLFLLGTAVCSSAAPHYHSFHFKLSSLKVTCFLTQAVKPNSDLMTPEQAHIKITINNY